jgi:hypothetical protein
VVTPAQDKPSKQGYGIYAWRRPVLVGCALPVGRTRDDAFRCDTATGAQRLYIVKPALDLARLLSASPARLAAADRPVAGGGLLEVAAYVRMRVIDERERGEFPQHRTVSMTLASDAARYGAYRELARHQMGRALRLRAAGGDTFEQEMRCQNQQPLTLSPDPAPSTAGSSAAASCDVRWDW